MRHIGNGYQGLQVFDAHEPSYDRKIIRRHLSTTMVMREIVLLVDLEKNYMKAYYIPLESIFYQLFTGRFFLFFVLGENVTT